MNTTQADVIIIGAGLSGLSCALHLQEAGISSLILERADEVGGRIRTDVVDGFQLDRGFQVLLTAYPEAQQLLDYERLDLRAFESGALVWLDKAFHRTADPFRHPAHLISTLRAPVGSVRDKMNMLTLRRKLAAGGRNRLLQAPELTTEAALRDRWGFSERMIDAFFRPFLGGVTLDRKLQTSSRFFEFVMDMFAKGVAAVPAKGMQAIPKQLAGRLPKGTIRLNTGVKIAEPARGVILEDGEQIDTKAVVVAASGPEAYALTGAFWGPLSRSVACVYFAAEKAPLSAPVLVLDGDGKGPANNLAVMSNVAPSYAPPGAALLSLTVLGSPSLDDAALEGAVRGQMRAWFGPQVHTWRHLRTYRIWHALPVQEPPALEPYERPVRFGAGHYICGDHRDQGSIQGALASGRRAAEAVIQDLPLLVNEAPRQFA